MDNIYFLILRRMRTPLLALVGVYAVAIVGLVLMPGQDAAGQPWQLDFFHAFYVLSYTATTIGFGELPYTFSAAQRLWMLFCIYASVVVWLYSIGSLIALLQNKTLQRALAESRFAAQVRALREPFYLICGYGQTGSGLVRALSEEHRRTVVIDANAERIHQLKLEKLPEFVPALQADAHRPDALLLGGLRRPLCRYVLALTSSNEVNLKIAIAAKLLHPRAQVICRADSHDIEANMASFGTDHIFDPFDLFAVSLATALRAPCLELLRTWLAETRGAPLREPVLPPARGLWVLCGYGRFGKAIYRHLAGRELELVTIEAAPELTGIPPGRWVQGRGTEAETLEQADIRQAVGLIAGTDHDANNLSIIMTARELNPKLFVVARENELVNRPLFDAVAADLRMHPSLIVAERIRLLLRAPLLDDFIARARYQTNDWACALVSRIAALTTHRAPEVWELRLDEEQAFAVVQRAQSGAPPLTLGELLRHPRACDTRLAAIALLHQRGDDGVLVPTDDERLRPHDRLLFCGTPQARAALRWTLQNRDVLSYVLGEQAPPRGWLLGRWLRQRTTRTSPA